MNVVFFSNDIKEAEVLNRALTEFIPSVRFEVSPNVQDALVRLSIAGACNVLLLDTSVPAADAVHLITAIRNEKKPVGIVALVGTTERQLPAELINAGADRFILKRAGFIVPLADALQQANERYQTGFPDRSHPARLLYAGDIKSVQGHLSGLPHVVLESVPVMPDGTLQLPDTGASRTDLLVVDSAATGAQTLRVIKEITLRAPDIPIILLTDPGDEDTAIESMKMGAADCIARTDHCFDRLLPVLEREIRRLDLALEKAALKSREDRLRQIVETMPVGVTVIAPDGNFLAINRAGLRLMGAARFDQIVGKNLIHLLPNEERKEAFAFIARVCGGTNSSVHFEWKGLDGSINGLDLLGVPLRRDASGAFAALAAMNAPAAHLKGQSTEEETQKKCEELSRTLLEYQERIRDLQEKQSLQESQCEVVLRQAEARCLAAEEQLAKLKSASEETANQFNLLLEEQRTALQHALNEAESRLAQQAEEHSAECSQRDSLRHDLEQKLQAAAEQLTALQHALNEAESRLAQQAEEHSAECSQRDSLRHDLEQKLQAAAEQLAALQHALNEAESRLAQQAEEHSAALSRWDHARLESEQKIQAAEQQHAVALKTAIDDAESRLALISEDNRAKSLQLEETARQNEQLNTGAAGLKTELAHLQRRHNRLFQLASAGIILATREGLVLECNDAAARMFGYAAADEALAQTGDHAFRIYAFQGELDSRLQRDRILQNVEWASLGHDSGIVWFHENSILVEAPDVEGPLVERVLTDTSRIHRFGEEIRRTHRLGCIGDPTGATVKSLRDLFASLANCGKQLMEKPEDSGNVRQVAEILIRDAYRGVKYAGQFLTVFSKADRTHALLNLNEILIDNDSLLHSLAGEDIDLQTVLSPRVGLVMANRQEMVQLISNLVASSREALPMGGAITVETANTDIDASAAGHPKDMPSGIYVLITISGDGCAVQPERRTISNRVMIKRMGGWLESAHDNQSGNTHKIYLPRVEAFANR